MKQIIVEPDRLDDVARRVEQACQDYDRLYASLYAQVDRMSDAWEGKDNVMYTAQIRNYEEDFQQISLIMKQYVEFLRNSARAYRETQDELYSQATRL